MHINGWYSGYGPEKGQTKGTKGLWKGVHDKGFANLGL